MEHLLSDVPGKTADKRLAVELAAIRESLVDPDGIKTWTYPGGDDVRWISTATMISDALTKNMRPDFILKVLKTNSYTVQTLASRRSAQ